MTAEFVVSIGRETVTTALLVVGPIMLVGFVVGMAVSFIQAIMQIHEMTLAFVPKLFAIGMSIIVFGHWMLQQLMGYTEKLLGGFPNMIN